MCADCGARYHASGDYECDCTECEDCGRLIPPGIECACETAEQAERIRRELEK